MTTAQTRPILYVIVNNHFDLTWRRCWQQPFTFHGKTFVSYADLQAAYMLDNLALAAQHPEYKFEAENTQVVRSFLMRCPEKHAVLQQLAQQGRFAITGGGEAIVDANMITGKTWRATLSTACCGWKKTSASIRAWPCAMMPLATRTSCPSSCAAVKSTGRPG